MTRQADAESSFGEVVLFSETQTCGVADVERINPFWFYEFAKDLKDVTAFSGDVKAEDVMFDVLSARRILQQLLEGKPIPLGLSRASAMALVKHLNEVVDKYFSGPAGADGKPTTKWPEKDATIPQHTWNWFRHLLTKFETIFSEEMRESATYFVPRKGIFSTPALIDHADESFPVDVRGTVPEKTKTDWKAAGRCLAFNLHSASGFHVARAVEGMLEAYYQLFSGKTGETLHSWYDYIQALKKIAEAKDDPAPSEKTLTELEQMKDDYRNPIVHPRVVLTEGDARMLFNNGESLIIAMGQEIGAAREAGIQPRLSMIAGALALPAGGAGGKDAG